VEKHTNVNVIPAQYSMFLNIKRKLLFKHASGFHQKIPDPESFFQDVEYQYDTYLLIFLVKIKIRNKKNRRVKNKAKKSEKSRMCG
jgi:hypothetical protein